MADTFHIKMALNLLDLTSCYLSLASLHLIINEIKRYSSDEESSKLPIEIIKLIHSKQWVEDLDYSIPDARASQTSRSSKTAY